MGGVKAATALAKSNVEIAKVLAPTIVDAAKGIGVEAAEAMAPAIVDASKALGSDAAVAIANSNLAIAKEIMPVVGAIGAVGVTIYGVTQLQPPFQK